MSGIGGTCKRVSACIAIALLAAAALFLTPILQTESSTQAQADTAKEAAFVAALNQTRRDLGLNELIVNDELTTLSRGWASEMATEGAIFHANPISANMTTKWIKLGENVGVGPQTDSLVDAFIASPTHYENIIDPNFTHIGVGVIWQGDLMYTTHRFMKPADLTISTLTTTPLEAATN